MQFRTEIGAFNLTPKICYTDRIFSIGSCFSVEIAARLRSLRYRVHDNPAGITFNPISIADILKMIKTGDSLPGEDLLFNGSTWCHPLFHSSFNQLSKEDYIRKTVYSLSHARHFLSECSWVIITLGTAFVHDWIAGNMTANNCHKLPGDQFRKRRLTVEEIVDALNSSTGIIESMSSTNVNFILTVSPVRHTREGLHENQLSKALCLLAADKVSMIKPNVHYFPSYEIMMDDLRDYRFYGEDLIHPTSFATDYIFDTFSKGVLDEDEEEIRTAVQKINRKIQHKPFNPDSEAYDTFQKNLASDIKAFNSKYGHLGMGFD